ncbi:hypothetical protein RS85_00262 [Microbacterium sp. SA39]|nr:hypothetical protein RS85_00262 [Microbacterium sp. SA39]
MNEDAMNTKRVLRAAMLGVGAYVSSLLLLLVLGVTLGLNEYLVVAVTVIVFMPLVTGVFRAVRKRRSPVLANGDPISANE